MSKQKNTFTIGNAKLVNTAESLYLISPEEKINLTDYEGCGFVINSYGELLFGITEPFKK